MNANKVFGLLTYFSISSFIFGLIEIVQFGILIKASVIVFGKYPSTLESGIEVEPTVINLAFFSRPYGHIRDYIKVI